MAAYLNGHRHCPQPLDRLLARAALGNQADAAELLDVDAFLRQAPDFTGPRKRALIDAVLHLLGVGPAPQAPAAEAFSQRGLHPWARVQVTAVKIILAHARGAMDEVGDQDVSLLRSTQHPGAVWEGNLLIHLSVLHALSFVCGLDQLVEQGIQTVLEHQRKDGGMPFICEEDTWVTATAGIALHATGADQRVLNNIAGHLISLQDPSGGWSYSERAQLTDVDCTSAALEVLQLTDPAAHHIAIRQAVGSLHAVRGQDGGFPTYLAGAPSEACMTAAAVNALATQGAAQHGVVNQALAYLSSRQHEDGTFPPDWSSSRHHTVFRAALAASVDAGGPGSHGERILRRCRSLVLDTQEPDGGWGQQDGAPSDALSTAYALITLTAVGDGRETLAAATRASAYLLTQQRPDGSIASVPDSIGPRPFGFTIPALADVFTLLALGHLTHRITPAKPVALGGMTTAAAAGSYCLPRPPARPGRLTADA
ncbi:prenyltransferase/squalene oxidase repeat-containing protein [Streptomyces sp. NPDC048361]|uniref:prenyltransferase/squalene oxidase repeat-containing protein n=1 Tax=Streptomyces sp. NPDC048361 TaxID=3154720 RepID=UPI003424AF93